MSNNLITSQIQKRNELMYFMFAAFTPVFFSIFWFLSNTQLPATDAVDYLGTAHKIYQNFVNDGIWSGLVHCFTERGWRPILFPILSVPFLLMSHGSVMFAYNAVAVLCILASAIYVYLFLRLQLDRYSSLVGANLICLLPLVQMPALIFVAECALFPLVIGTLYHLIQSDYFRNKKHLIGFIICMALAILIRPVETVTDLFFVFAVLLFLGAYQKIFSFKQITSVVVIGLFSSFLFLFYIGTSFTRYYPFQPLGGGIYDIKLAKMIYRFSVLALKCLLFTGSILILINMLPWFRARYHQAGRSLHEPPVIVVFGIICFIFLLWFLPYAFPTFQWIFQTSFGDIAEVSLKSIQKQSVWTVIYSYISEESLATVLGIVFVALSGLLVLKAKQMRDVIFSTAFIYLLLLMPFPIWEVLNTSQTGSRKLSLAFSGLLMALLILGLQRGKFWVFRLGLISSLLIAQLISGANIFYPRLLNDTLTIRLGSYPQPFTIQPNPHDVMLNFLDMEAPKYKLKNILIEESWMSYMPVYPYLVQMMSKLTSHEYELSYLFYNSYPDDIEKQLSTKYDGVFLINNKSNMVISDSFAKRNHNLYANETLPDIKIFNQFLYKYAQDKLNDIGWKLGPCVSFKGNDRVDYSGCLFISLNKPVLNGKG